MSKKDKILALHKEGKSYKQITEVTGIPKGTISYHIQKAGFSRNGTTGEDFTNRERIRVTARKRDYKRKAVELLGGKCSKCGYKKCPAALEFHHLDRTRKDGVISDLYSWDSVVKELSKCILVCSNCHREIHYVD